LLASTLRIPDLRSINFDPSSPSLLEDLCLIHKVAAGRYSLLPLGALILERMKDVFRIHMQRSGAVETVFLTMSPANLWQDSGRWESFGSALIKTKRISGEDICFNPTHEEMAVSIMKSSLRSYRELPVNIFCIQKVYRDEPRPKSELVRTHEFYMADSYSFHRDPEDAEHGYRKMQKVFANIFREYKLPHKIIHADNGKIGGSKSVEFQFEHSLGESRFASCDCGYACDLDIQPIGTPCPQCNKNITTVVNGIEVAHIFLLGSIYSERMNLRFRNADNSLVPPQMGCTGIGMTRVLHTLVLHHMYTSGIAWPTSVAPFDVILKLGNKPKHHMTNLRDRLEARSVRCLVDDRPLSVNAKESLVRFLNPQFVVSELASDTDWELSTLGQKDEKLNLKDIEQQICNCIAATRSEQISNASSFV
jgi:prolyl-tRNA synthetase